MKRKIKLLYVAAELSPYANAGGLGEVGRSFPKALVDTDRYDVRRVMPLHKGIGQKLRYSTDFAVPMEHGFETCIVKKDTENKEIETYFISNSRYFYRDQIYGYEDDGLRYFFFCKAVIEMLKHITFKPDIVHVNDWHTGFLPLLIRKEFPEMKTVFTIHNITYHGFIPASYLEGLLTEKELQILGWPEWLNFMKAGIVYSDLLTTVSPGYAEEIRRPELSSGMSIYIEQRAKGIVGITNGIDGDSYDPQFDGVLTHPYSIHNLDAKKANRSELRRSYGLSDADLPLAAMVTRLDSMKGIDLVINSVKQMNLSDFQLIILGSGTPYYQGMLASLAAEYPDRIAVDFKYSQEKAKKIYGAADIYLMPSRFEPCGLGQLYAMRYGAVPIIYPVGGLKDTVTDDNEDSRNSTGFYMPDWSWEALSLTLARAIKSYHKPEWKDYVLNCMNYDSSWKKSVIEYSKRYEEILEDR